MTIMDANTVARRKYPLQPAMRLTLAAMAMLPLTGQADTINVDILFVDHCPQGDPESEITLSKTANDKVVWQSVKSNGNGGTVDSDEDYKIYFDPFKSGPALKSNGRGQVKSQPLHTNVPLGGYKYTIVGDDCQDQPLDPRIRVQ